MPPKKPAVADLAWTGDLRFDASINNHSLTLDSASKAGPTPVETLALSLAGCMAIDVVHIITRGRHPLTALRAHLVGERASEDPHRFVRITLQLTVAGPPRDVVERAAELSHEKYCSVWHSMRQDIDFQVAVAVE